MSNRITDALCRIHEGWGREPGDEEDYSEAKRIVRERAQEVRGTFRAPTEIERLRTALEDIALLDEADGHELKVGDAFRAVAIATSTLGKHPSEICAARYAAGTIPGQRRR